MKFKKTIITFISILLITAFAVTTSAATVYTVKSGDTLWKIASKNQTGISELIAANPQVKNINLIYPGQKLNIPAPSSFAAMEDEVITTIVAQLLIFFVILGAIMHGVIKESINIWLPTMLENVKGFSMESTLGILFIVPVINFSGIFLSKLISNKTKTNSYATIVVITVISIVFSVVLLFTQQYSSYILVVITIILFGMMFAMNPIFTSFLPLTFSKWKVVSTMAGIIDFAIYLGAAFASLLTGYLFENSGWFAVTVMWFIALILCLVFTMFSNKIYKNNKN